MTNAAEPLTADSFVALIIIAVALLGGAFYLASKVYFWIMNRRLDAAEAPTTGGGVKHYTLPPARDYVTHEPARVADTATDPGLSAGLSVPSARSAQLPAPVTNIMIDRSRAGLIAALVAAGWKTGEIRAQLKGDNSRIGEEVEAERVRQGLAPAAPRLSPIAGRELPADAKFFDEQPAEVH
jgi:hypothetical protein